MREHGLIADKHAGVEATSEVMLVDREHLLVADNGTMGVDGDPTRASVALGEEYVNVKT